MATNTNHTSTSRRYLLRGGIAAAAAAVAGSVLGREKASAHGELHVEGSPAIHAVSTGSVAVVINGIDEGALHAECTHGPAINGTSTSGTGIVGHGRYEGVIGQGRDGAGVLGYSDVAGVHGKGNRIGVFGQTPRTTEVEPTGRAGVYGLVTNQLDVGIVAENQGDGFALEARGRTLFTTGGRGTIEARQSNALVESTVVTANSHITVTLTGSPGAGKTPVSVQWVERHPNVGFILHLTGAVKDTTPFTYLIVEYVAPSEWLE